MNSARLSRQLLLVFTILGALVAGYLTYIYLFDANVLCTGVGGCDAVKASRYSYVMGIPVAVIGLIGYLAILAGVLLEKVSPQAEQYGPVLVFGMSLVGLLYSIYLTYLELAVIKAVCPYCVASAVIMLVVFAIATYRLMKADA